MRNVDKRDDFIKKFGKEKFLETCKKDPKFEQLQDIPCPPECSWIFKHFMQIWQGCEYDMMGNIIFTFRTVNDYVECMKVPLSVEDKKLIFKMKAWAVNTISEMKDKEEQGG